ncbi:hypothetical protein [Ginsengibacter hankyongi]|uniref:hypothetical protein n=1 Tax=Ginsengibacter hankyongi TaxID=2607284 RepID=UPI001928D6BF|nr:hypothetical protein [Ginsengibacter hankyongi]
MTETNLLEKKKLDLELVTEAHEQAERDIGKDPDLNLEPKTGDDLDEGELSRLEGEK